MKRSHSPEPIWVSATDIRNYMLKDPMTDWLKMKPKPSTDAFTKFILKQGQKFESMVVDLISKVVPVVYVSNVITDETVDKTHSLMRQGTPVIHSAPVMNMENHTRGVIDLLVRNDYISKFIANPPNLPNVSSILGDYYYVVIDIKFSTLPLCSERTYLLNEQSIPAYKGQCLIYTEAIGKLQGYTPTISFILGRGWNCISKGIKYSDDSCFDRLGVMDFSTRDLSYVECTGMGIQWRRDLATDGHKWTAGSRPELFPNTNSKGEFALVQKKMAEDMADVTIVWQCGAKQREHAMRNGVFSWKDERCTAEVLGFKDGSRKRIVDAILSINRQSEELIRPAKIASTKHDWRDESYDDLYVDFETIPDIFGELNSPIKQHTSIIFMIGVYHLVREYNEESQMNEPHWTYTHYTALKPTMEEERRIMKEFYEFVSKLNKPRLWYWFAEKNFWQAAENRQPDEYDSPFVNRLNWVDLLDVFHDEPIVIKDCFGFGLKEICKTMKKHGMRRPPGTAMPSVIIMSK